jgi:REP element-mobilizing transposase RayT
MELNEFGQLVEIEWLKTIELRPDMNLELGNFVVMPNHFHAIIIIGENEFNLNIIQTPNKFGPQSKNLVSIIRGFKSAVTTNAKITGIINFAWQDRYHDHIIRNHSKLY